MTAPIHETTAARRGILLPIRPLRALLETAAAADRLGLSHG